MPSEYFDTVKRYVLDLELEIVREDEAEELFVVDNEEEGIKTLVIDCEDPILVIEQLILKVKPEPGDLYRRLLQMNRTLVHGAFVLDESGENVLFRDTLQLANLDANELEGSVSALSLALAEYGAELLDHARRD
ncbi:MAG: YbjN domain-containing protein [Acidobacteriota bacterium]